MAITHSTHEAPTQEVALPPALAMINSNVLDDAILKKLVDPDVYYALAQCRATGVPMDRDFANALAKSIREWAQSKGCIGYSHWFSPMRGAIHGEKLETFVGVDFATDRLIINLTGSELFQTETDGSSFPNGGLRETHRAAAYIGWGHRIAALRLPADALHPVRLRHLERRGPRPEDPASAGRHGGQRAERAAALAARGQLDQGGRVQCGLGAGILPDRQGEVPGAARPGGRWAHAARRGAAARPGDGRQLLLQAVAPGEPLRGRGARQDVGARDLDPLHAQRGRPRAARDFAGLRPREPRGGHQRARHGRASRPRLRPRFHHPVSREALRRHQRHRQAQQLGAQHRHRRQPLRAGGDGGREPALHRLRRGAAARGQPARRPAALRRVDGRQRPPARRPGGAARDHYAASGRAPGSPCQGGRRGRRLRGLRKPAQGDRDRGPGRRRAGQSGRPATAPRRSRGAATASSSAPWAATSISPSR